MFRSRREYINLMAKTSLVILVAGCLAGYVVSIWENQGALFRAFFAPGVYLGGIMIDSMSNGFRRMNEIYIFFGVYLQGGALFALAMVTLKKIMKMRRHN